MNEEKNRARFTQYHRLEEVVGCKWSVSVLMSVREGIRRPGALERHIRGISSKVLSERLRKLTHYGLLTRHSYAEVPPRTEYTLTAVGRELVQIIERIQELDTKHSDAEAATQPDGGSADAPPPPAG